MEYQREETKDDEVSEMHDCGVQVTSCLRVLEVGCFGKFKRIVLGTSLSTVALGGISVRLAAFN